MVTHGLQTGESVIPSCLQFINVVELGTDNPLDHPRNLEENLRLQAPWLIRTEAAHLQAIALFPKERICRLL